MKNRISLFCFAVLLVLTISATGRSQVVVDGNPPLTEETIGRFAELFEWGLDVHFTNEQQRLVRDELVEIWTRKKTSEIESVIQGAQSQIDLAKVPADQRGLIRMKFEQDLLADLRAQPNDPKAVLFLGVYDSGHKAIAAGKPPLTRQAADAFVESLYFMVGEVSGQHFVPDQTLKNDWANELAANYAKFPVETKQMIAGMPLFAATVRVGWPTLSESDKQTLRTQWARDLKSLLPSPAPAVSSNSSSSKTSGSATASRKMTAAEAMAEQNRRFRMHMNTSNAMMDIYKIRFNTQANLGGNSYRYW